MNLLLVVAVAVSVASVEIDALPAEQPHPVAAQSLVPGGGLAATDLAKLESFSAIMNEVVGQLAQAAAATAPGQLSKRDILDVIPQLLRDVTGGYISDVAAAGKLVADNILTSMGKRSVREEGNVQKREIFTDLFNLLVGNVEGAVTGMDII